MNGLDPVRGGARYNFLRRPSLRDFVAAIDRPTPVLSAQTKDAARLDAIGDEIWAAAEHAFYHAQHTKLMNQIRLKNCKPDVFEARLRADGAPEPPEGDVCTSAFHKNVAADHFSRV